MSVDVGSLLLNFEAHLDRPTPPSQDPPIFRVLTLLLTTPHKENYKLLFQVQTQNSNQIFTKTTHLALLVKTVVWKRPLQQQSSAMSDLWKTRPLSAHMFQSV